ncbi:4-hydroxy-tetrahydrodipicolinate synthase [Noviherbaspirillum humi]|uniref:4-hydroxy-tetrahydrodipicolinate synthase n=1 Tax=Noviherbaspirillum humi TaxID=1688639 RepID=A0A239JVN8_9BURK|nr:dihydrodipicolinate synthase family protein [Noviherbaspirillum humi]SNT08944.1 4-hydroxy-tetrahydrodipicolinate synthase [Noviherbaspirillum humi]
MKTLDSSAKGAYLIAVTPFADDGSLDLASTDRMVDFYLEKGATGLTILGIMGEAPKLTAEESRIFVRQVLARVNGRVPVIVGASAPGFAPMRELTESVMELGASGVMVAPPSTVRTDDQIVAYFDMVNETLGPEVPWCLQDHPVATGVQMSASVILRVLKNSPTCVMLKHEDNPGLAKLSAIRAAGERGDAPRVSILTGNGGGLFLPEELTRGADGAMTGFAYPEMMVDVVKAHAAGDVERAHDIFDAYLPLARYEQQPGVGLAVRKHLMLKRGVIASEAVRKPGPKLSAADVADIERLVARQTRRLQEIGRSGKA